MNRHTQNNRKKHAQAMVEFALALPILLLLVFGLMETGRLLFIYASTVSAAREAVRYGAAMGKNPSNVPFYQDCAGIRNAAKNVAFINTFNDSDIQITYDGGLNDTTGAEISLSPANPSCGSLSSIKNGDRIKVIVSTQWQPIVSLVPLKPFTITASSKRTVIKSISIPVAAAGTSGPPPPVLMVPAEGAVFLNPGTINFTWNASSGATQYWFEYIGTASGSSGWINGTSTSATLGNGTYTWHVKAKNTSGESSWSSSRTFIIGSTPLAPNLLSPVEGAHVASGTAPNFTWDVSTGATQYFFEYSDTNGFNVSLGNSTWISTTDFSTASLTAGTYYWRVRARNVSGTSPWSVVRSLIVDPSGPLPIQKIMIIVDPPTSSSPLTLKVGDIVSFKFSLQNNNSLPITFASLVITGDGAVALDGNGCLGEIPAGQAIFCTGTRIINQADIDRGTINNTEIANGTYALGDVSSSSTNSLAISQTPALSVNASGSPSSPTSLNQNMTGTTITFTYILTNTGNVTLAPSITDNKSGATLVCTGDMAPGTTKNCTGTYTVTSANVTAGSFINTGTVTDLSKNINIPTSITVLTKVTCTKSTVYFSSKPENTTSSSVIWTIKNDTNVPLTITTLNVKWDGNGKLHQAFLPATTSLWSSTSGNSSNDFNIPVVPLTLPTGSTDLRLIFSKDTKIAIKITLETGCETIE